MISCILGLRVINIKAVVEKYELDSITTLTFLASLLEIIAYLIKELFYNLILVNLLILK